MDKEFVTYEQALELKKIGFINPCFGAFIGEEFKFFNFSNDIKGYVNENNLIIGRPTYSQAFSWIRKKYDIIVWIKRRKEFEKKYSFYINESDNTNENYFELHFESYEKAESMCLDKLIEIVKEKKEII